MATITVRSIKGSPLTQAEVDQNFINLNTDKLDTSGLALGSAASPSLTFTGDSNTGIYSPGADQLSVATGGVQRLRIDSAGNVNVTTSSLAQYFGINATGTAASVANGLFAPTGNTLGFVTNATERARIDSNGRLLVGTSASITAVTFPALVQSNSFYSYSASLFSADANSSNFFFLKSRNATTGSHTVVQQNDVFGQLLFAGSDGTAFISGAGIAAAVDGTPGLNDMPGRLVFSTTADGAAIPTERMRIDSSGRVGIGVAGPNSLLHLGHPAVADIRFTVNSVLQSNIYASTSDTSIYSVTGTPLIFGTNNTERARIDSSGRLLVGTSSARGIGAGTFGVFQVEQAGIAIASITTNTNDTEPGYLILGKSRGTTIGSSTVVQSGDRLGEIRFAGGDGTDVISLGASIQAFVDGTPGADDMPGRLAFSTTPDGTAIPTERLRITNDGVQAYNQPAPAAVNATATLTAANLKAGIITSTSAAATDMTLPTGTDTQAGFSGTYDNMTFEWSVINTGPSLVRVLAGTAHTVVGSGSVATGTSGRFASRRTAANTFVTYRLS